MSDANIIKPLPENDGLEHFDGFIHNLVKGARYGKPIKPFTPLPVEFKRPSRTLTTVTRAVWDELDEDGYKRRETGTVSSLDSGGALYPNNLSKQ